MEVHAPPSYRPVRSIALSPVETQSCSEFRTKNRAITITGTQRELSSTHKTILGHGVPSKQARGHPATVL